MGRALWWEVYSCGCVSGTLTRKRDLLGYCGQHGSDRSELWQGKERKDRPVPEKEERPDD